MQPARSSTASNPSEDSYTASNAFRLLDLPDELVQLVLQFVALLEYEYGESRRPDPSPLHALAHSRNWRLRRLAMPLLHRRARTSDPHLSLVVDGEVVSSAAFVRSVRHFRNVDESEPQEPPSAYPNLVNLSVRSDGPLPAEWLEGLVPLRNLRSLELRRTGLHLPWTKKRPQQLPPDFPRLTSLSLFHNLEWLFVFATLSTIKHLTVVLDTRGNLPQSALKNWDAEPLWKTVESFVLHVPPPALDESITPIKTYLEGLALPPARDMPLRSLSIITQLQNYFATLPKNMRDITGALSPFSQLPLTSLALDEYAACEPADLAALASSFPALKSLSLGDRIVWKGERVNLLSALSPLRHLVTLSCPLFPDAPSSRFRPLLLGPDDSPEHLEDFASPVEIALEAAAVLPALSLVGFSGRQSTAEWWRIGRNTETGAPDQADAVELYCTDLDRP
ncbi:hypothetical protein JCM5296_004461 [Sporobolomyces johnsonii]